VLGTVDAEGEDRPRRKNMPTRKNIVSKAAEVVPSMTKKRSSRKRKTQAASSPRSSARASSRLSFSKYLAPGAAVLAVGALSAAGYVLREQLGEVIALGMAKAATQGTKMTASASKAVHATREQAEDVMHKASDVLSIDALLRAAGLQRRNPVMSVLGPAAGALCGLVAGSALTFFFAPKLLAQITDKGATAAAPEAEEEPSHDAVISPASGPADSTVNGGFHRGVL
jgi:hypothetical protein